MKLNAYILALYSSDMSQSISRDDSTIVDLAEAGQRTPKLEQATPIRISSGHRILHHEGKCSRPHGHNYEITVEVTGQLTEEGGSSTSTTTSRTSSTRGTTGSSSKKAIRSSTRSKRRATAMPLVVLDHPPTAEVMSVLLEQRMLDAFPDTVSDVSVSVSETGELCASY